VPAYVAFVRRVLAVHPTAVVLLTEGAIVNDEADPTRPQRSVLRGFIRQTVQQLSDARVRQVDSARYRGTACDAHPTAEEHAAMARDFEPEIRRQLGW
jgi:hypothetical protein